MADLVLSLNEIDASLEQISSHFQLPITRKPRVELDPTLPGEGKFYYQREPYFHGGIIINPDAEMTQEKGFSYILTHALIHWAEWDNNLNSYRGCPAHLLTILYQGGEERERVLNLAQPRMTTDIFFGKRADPQRREELLRYVDQHYNQLRQRVIAYAATSGEVTRQNVQNVAAILQEAHLFSTRHKLNVGEEAIYSFMCQDYADLLSVYGAEKLPGPNTAVSFLRELRRKREMMQKSIGNSKLTVFLDFEKYATLLEQFSSSA